MGEPTANRGRPAVDGGHRPGRWRRNLGLFLGLAAVGSLGMLAGVGGGRRHLTPPEVTFLMTAAQVAAAIAIAYAIMLSTKARRSRIWTNLDRLVGVYLLLLFSLPLLLLAADARDGHGAAGEVMLAVTYVVTPFVPLALFVIIADALRPAPAGDPDSTG